MSTDIRPELSKKNKYYIPKERFYELKHYCLQYKSWQRAYNALNPGIHTIVLPSNTVTSVREFSDPTGNVAASRTYFYNKMAQIQRIAREADPELAPYILLAVTSAQSYVYQSTKLRIPCSKDIFYDRYHKFFWLLSQERE